jgi:hypothetical protein
MIRKRDDPTKKLSVIKRHPDDSPYLVNQQQHFQTGVSVDQNPLHQRVSGGLWCIVSCPFIRKRNGNHGSFEDLLLLGKANRKRKRDCPTDGMWDSLALNIVPLFLCSFPFLFILSPSLLRYLNLPIGRRRRDKLVYRLFCMCACVCVCYRCIPQGCGIPDGRLKFSIYYIERNEPL